VFNQDDGSKSLSHQSQTDHHILLVTDCRDSLLSFRNDQSFYTFCCKFFCECCVNKSTPNHKEQLISFSYSCASNIGLILEGNTIRCVRNQLCSCRLSIYGEEFVHLQLYTNMDSPVPIRAIVCYTVYVIPLLKSFHVALVDNLRQISSQMKTRKH
jgi:hypothetical protein